MMVRSTRIDRAQWVSIAFISTAILGLNVLGWGLLLGVVAPRNYSLGAGGVLGVGLGVTAFTLGMRHAFDADHIAAIDNTTRKLMAAGQRPVSVGFWFSLGHSTVVFGLFLILAAGVRGLTSQVVDADSTLQHTLSLVGTLVSGTFLLLIAWMNFAVFRRIVRVFRQMRQGEFDELELDRHLNSRGLLNRMLGRWSKLIERPWQMYPLGLLFGLGFDTATQVGLLVLAGGAAAFAIPWYALLCLPILFAAGMTLLDSIDGCFMNFAYGWALSKPVRKIYYNLVFTGLSIGAALLIGGVEIAGLLGEVFGIATGPLAWMGSVDLNYAGFLLVTMFVVTFIVAIGIYKFGRVEDRLSQPSTAKR